MVVTFVPFHHPNQIERCCARDDYPPVFCPIRKRWLDVSMAFDSLPEAFLEENDLIKMCD